MHSGEESASGEASSTTASQLALATRNASFQRSPAPMLSTSRKTSSSGQPVELSHCLKATAATLSVLEWLINRRNKVLARSWLQLT